MKLERNGFVMRIAYFDKATLPDSQVNICPTFWRFMYGICLLPIVFIIDFLLMAGRPAILRGDRVDGKRELPHVFYSWWPKGKNFRDKDGDPIPPIVFLLALALLGIVLLMASILAFLLWITASAVIKTPRESFAPIIQAVWSTGSLIVLLSIFAGFILIRYSGRIWNSEPILLGRGFIRSKREKLCFMIEIENK